MDDLFELPQPLWRSCDPLRKQPPVDAPLSAGAGKSGLDLIGRRPLIEPVDASIGVEDRNAVPGEALGGRRFRVAPGKAASI